MEDQATLPGDRVPPKYMVFGILESPGLQKKGIWGSSRPKTSDSVFKVFFSHWALVFVLFFVSLFII